MDDKHLSRYPCEKLRWNHSVHRVHSPNVLQRVDGIEHTMVPVTIQGSRDGAPLKCLSIDS